VEKASGEQFACKSIKKRLNIPNVSADKQAQHIDNVEREITILKRLRGTLRQVWAGAAPASAAWCCSVRASTPALSDDNGSLPHPAPCSVVQFKGAWEDDEDLHIVMEYCSGGELHHTIGRRSYTEGAAAGYMRSVLHTLAQCHSHRILHRDVKPGNFMLLSDEEEAPLKAIDFGLAVFYDPGDLPRTDLGLDGTPW
jgi:calcium-dependent protein kinase